MKNISQKYIATMLNKSQSAYSRMESGRIQIPSEDLAGIAEVLGCQPADLLSVTGVNNVLKNDYTTFSKDYEPYVTAENKRIQLLLDHQTNLIEEMKAFINLQSQQMIMMQEVILNHQR